MPVKTIRKRQDYDFRPQGNLPLPLSTFVGRQEQKNGILELISDHRMITLTGAPGVGKSRLALQAASEAAEHFGDGAWFIALGDLTNKDTLAETVCRSVIPKGYWSGPPSLALVDYLSSRSALLVFDDCEHLVEACAQLVVRLLRRCPGLKVLAASQQPIGVSGESVWGVPPMAIPAAGEPESFETVLKSEAFRLFVERAAAARDGFDPVTEGASVIAQICRRLDGLPLAIELAAARVASLSPGQILQRLDSGLGLLSGGPHDTGRRHESFEAALECSYGRLSRGEAALLRRVSVFSGGWTLEAAESVCSQIPVGRGQVIQHLSSLVSKSLVVSEAGGSGSRYRLLTTIRQFALERLDGARRLGDLRALHGQWCVNLVEEAEQHLGGPDHQTWDARVAAERENLRASLEWAVEGNRAEIALRLVGALSSFWRMRGDFDEGLSWFQTVLSLGDEETAPGTRAKAFWGAGRLAGPVGLQEEAVSWAEESLELARQLGNDRVTARALNLLGALAMFREGPSAALVWLEESVSEARKAADPWCLADSLALCSQAHFFLGDATAAKAFAQECLEVSGAAEDLSGKAFGLICLGWTAALTGDRQAGKLAFEEAALIGGRLDSLLRCETLTALGDIAKDNGEMADARKMLAAALALAESTRAPFAIARALSGFARLEQATKGPAAALPVVEKAASVAKEARLTFILVRNLQNLAALYRTLGDAEGSRRTLLEALDIARANEDKLATCGLLHVLAKQASSEGDYAQAFQMHHEEAVTLLELGEKRLLAVCFESTAETLLAQDHPLMAARLAGVAHNLRWPGKSLEDHCTGNCRCSSGPLVLRKSLGESKFDRAFAEGMAMSAEHAISHAFKGRGARGRPSSGWDSLTPAELNVVGLVAEGLTNGQVADRLCVSRRTIESHLAHVYMKLDLTSRTELAARAFAESHQP